MENFNNILSMLDINFSIYIYISKYFVHEILDFVNPFTSLHHDGVSVTEHGMVVYINSVPRPLAL